MKVIINERQLRRLIREYQEVGEVDTKGTYFGSERSWKKDLYKGFNNQEREKIGLDNDIKVSFELVRDSGGIKTYKVTFSGSKYEEILNSFSDDDRETINKEDMFITVDDRVSGSNVEIYGLNQIHFPKGIHPLLRGRNLGNKVYKEFIKLIGYTISFGNTKEFRNQLRKLAEDSEFESVLCGSKSEGWILIFDRNWSGNKNEILKIFKENICNPEWEIRSDIPITN